MPVALCLVRRSGLLPIALECGSKLIRYEGEAAHYCPNETACPPQIKGRIEHFISRKAMNIDGLGPETVDMFYRLGLIHNTDLYELKADDIKGWIVWEKSAENIITGLSRVRQFLLNASSLLWEFGLLARR